MAQDLLNTSNFSKGLDKQEHPVDSHLKPEDQNCAFQWKVVFFSWTKLRSTFSADRPYGDWKWQVPVDRAAEISAFKPALYLP